MASLPAVRSVKAMHRAMAQDYIGLSIVHGFDPQPA